MNSPFKRSRKGAFACVISAATVASLSHTQHVVANADSPDLETVWVTATQAPREGASLAVTGAVIDSQILSRVAHVHINEVMQQVAGGWVSRGNGQESLVALRSPVLTGAGGCGAIVMAYEGIPLRAPGFCNVNQLFDVNTEQAGRVEAIKGPGTALYGSGAMHGVVNVLGPSLSQVSQHSIGLEVGANDYQRLKYRYSDSQGPHRYVVAGNGASDGGYKDDSGFAQQKLNLRHRYEGDKLNVDSHFSATNLNQETAGFVRGYQAFKDSSLKRDNPNPEAYRDAWSMRALSHITLNLSDDSSVRVTPYWRRNAMEFIQHFLPWQAIEDNGHQSIGLNTSLHVDRQQWQLRTGLDMGVTEGWLKEFQPEPFSPNQPQGLHYDYDVDATASALWSQLSWLASEALTLSADLRYEYTDYDYTTHLPAGSACAEAASNCRFYRPQSGSDDFADWSWSVGAYYQLQPDMALYLRGSNGFRAPEATELYRLQAGQEQADLDAEEMTSLEVGIRGKSNAIAYELAFYSARKRDVIFQDSDRQNVSGAETSHEGLELALTYQLNERWLLDMDASLARHRYQEAVALLGSSGDIADNDVDTAPRHFGSARLQWQATDKQDLELEWVHMGRYYLEPDNNHRYQGHDLLNLRWQLQASEQLGLGIQIKNLTDRDYAERADFGFGSYRYFVGEPRSLFASVNYSF